MGEYLFQEIHKCVEPLVDDKTEDNIKEKEKLKKEEGNDFRSIYFTYQQECLLSQQMRQHVQLLTQHFLQTYKHPNLCDLASNFKQNLVSLFLLGSNL